MGVGLIILGRIGGLGVLGMWMGDVGGRRGCRWRSVDLWRFGMEEMGLVTVMGVLIRRKC